MFLSGQVRFRVLLLAIVLEVTFCVARDLFDIGQEILILLLTLFYY